MPKKIKPLSDIEIRRLSHEGNKAKAHSVGGVAGLLLVCKPPAPNASDEALGTKAWVLRATIGSQRRDIGLGGYPTVSVSQARNKARELRELISNGLDPLAQRKLEQSRLKAEQARAITFAEVAQQYISKKSMEFKTSKQTQRLQQRLKTYAFPTLGELIIADIDLGHIKQMLNPIWYEKNETANRTRLAVEAILDLATVEGLRSGDNPARWDGNLELIYPPQEKVQETEHRKALPYVEMPNFWKQLHNKTTGVAADCLKFIILTASRSNETREARWREIDWQEKLWKIPAERAKTKKEHIVPLSSQAITFLNGLPKDSDLIFPNSKGNPISDSMVSRVPKKLSFDVTAHGFRATFRTWVQEQTKFSEEAAELALAHVNTVGTRAAYARGAMIEQRAIMMQAWADYCYDAAIPADPPA